MSKLQYVPPHQLGRQHVGKPMKLLLKNGKEIYGTIKEVRKNGVVFIPAAAASRHQTGANQFFGWFIFIPFGFFIPFLIF
ncbi:hypothetical protein ACFO25_17290 [Paenactinomyces guangxiensis]|uniref:Uncharacterized protein n=1 Tax=Paenactinomyces guangxiensis TaxID=1490290 RepID=A0A7W2A8M2_9BACL|nr:hypothetical protein [Paenactinomyces guangxiensis]MBA4494780.1 hypothetical protein [Paenactinomyces guangxiensis]MBH8591864.1 hypothetical protein [Paenactinomyces guangxiensis]